MKTLIIILYSSFLFAQTSSAPLQHLLSAPKKVETNDITSVLLNQIDILRLTHKETMVHPESKVLKDLAQVDYISDWNGNGKLEVYEGKYPDANYWFTTKIYRSASKKVVRIEEIIRDGIDKSGKKKVIASIVNFDGYELKDRTICEGHVEKRKIAPKYKRFMASDDVNKEYPQVVLNCNTINESMCQQFERITKLNERFELNGKEYWQKFFTTEDHKQWIAEILNSHAYQTKQRDNFLDLKIDLKPGGKYSNIYWPKKLTHHQYYGFAKGSELSDNEFETLKSTCAEHTAYVAPAPEYIRAPNYPKKTPASAIGSGVASN